MERQLRTVSGFSTKYALTQGISATLVEREADSKYVYEKNGQYRNQLIVGRTFFESRKEAESNAKGQARRKAVALKKQLAKVEALAVSPWSVKL